MDSSLEEEIYKSKTILVSECIYKIYMSMWV